MRPKGANAKIPVAGTNTRSTPSGVRFLIVWGFLLTAEAEMRYNRDKYIQYNGKTE